MTRFEELLMFDLKSSFAFPHFHGTLIAIANDIGYSDIFVEQLKNYLSLDDMVVGISGSGNSANVIKALKFAKKKGAVMVAFCGYNGEKVSTIADLVIHVPVEDMEVCEDVHLIIARCCKKIIKKSIGKVNMEGRDYAKRIHM